MRRRIALQNVGHAAPRDRARARFRARRTIAAARHAPSSHRFPPRRDFHRVAAYSHPHPAFAGL